MTEEFPLRLLTPLDGEPWDIDGYVKRGGYEAWRQVARDSDPDRVIEELKRACLRGRGGAGFPTGLKWDKVVHHREKERYFVCNAGEHEPGTFKDRYLVQHHPHQLIEGCLIAAFTIGAREAYIYLNAEFLEARASLDKALEQARTRGFLGQNVLGSGVDLELEIFEGMAVTSPAKRPRCWSPCRAARLNPRKSRRFTPPSSGSMESRPW